MICRRFSKLTILNWVRISLDGTLGYSKMVIDCKIGESKRRWRLWRKNRKRWETSCCFSLFFILSSCILHSMGKFSWNDIATKADLWLLLLNLDHHIKKVSAKSKTEMWNYCNNQCFKCEISWQACVTQQNNKNKSFIYGQFYGT